MIGIKKYIFGRFGREDPFTCTDSDFEYDSSAGEDYQAQIDFGVTTGVCGVNLSMRPAPDSAYIVWDGKIMAATKLYLPRTPTNHVPAKVWNIPQTGWVNNQANRDKVGEVSQRVELRFNKNKARPRFATIYVLAGGSGSTTWNIQSIICP